jgi:hypothetical protein
MCSRGTDNSERRILPPRPTFRRRIPSARGDFPTQSQHRHHVHPCAAHLCRVLAGKLDPKFIPTMCKPLSCSLLAFACLGQWPADQLPSIAVSSSLEVVAVSHSMEVSIPSPSLSYHFASNAQSAVRLELPTVPPTVVQATLRDPVPEASIREGKGIT